MNRSMKSFVSSENMIETTENIRKQIKKFEGQEDRIKYLTAERDRYRDECAKLKRQKSDQFYRISDLNCREVELNGEIALLRGALDNPRQDLVEEDPATVEKPSRVSIKRVLGLTAILAPYALIGSYIVSLYV